MEAAGELDVQGTSHSRLTLTLRGDSELALRAAFRQAAPGQYDELVQQLVHQPRVCGYVEQRGRDAAGRYDRAVHDEL